MLTHLALGEWSEVLEEDMLPFRERLAIAFQFLDDKSLTSYLRRVTDRACSGGDIEGLLVTGLTKPGVDILQSYIDRTGDIQTGAILGSYVCPVKFLDGRVERWLEAYRDLLDGFKLHHHRVGFDIERGQRIQDAILQQQSAGGDGGEMGQGGGPGQAQAQALGGEWVPRQILLRCGFCSKPVNSGTALAKQKGQVWTFLQYVMPSSWVADFRVLSQATACPHCNRALPRCSICLLTLNIVQDGPREVELMNSQHRGTDCPFYFPGLTDVLAILTLQTHTTMLSSFVNHVDMVDMQHIFFNGSLEMKVHDHMAFVLLRIVIVDVRMNSDVLSDCDYCACLLTRGGGYSVVLG